MFQLLSNESALVRHEFDLVYWNMLHNYFRYNVNNPPHVPNLGDKKFLPQTILKFGHVDMGAFATRTKFVRQVGGLDEKKNSADWTLIQNLQEVIKPDRIMKLHRFLFIHN